MKNKILVVDDEVINLELIANLLEPTYNIYTANNAIDAIKSATDNIPDLILLDIIMPNIDGFELCKQIKKLQYLAGIPIIFLTSKIQDKDEAYGFEVGAVDYITKPFRKIVDMQRIALHIKLANKQNNLPQNNLSNAIHKVNTTKQIDCFFGLENEIKEHFRFTEAEVRLCQGLINGQTLEEISIENGVAYSTTRGYLRNIFAKTNTKKQHELVSSVMTCLLLMSM